MSVQPKLSHFPPPQSPAFLFLHLFSLLFCFCGFWSISQRQTPQSLIICCWWGGLTNRRYRDITFFACQEERGPNQKWHVYIFFFSHCTNKPLQNSGAVKAQPHLPSLPLLPLFPPFPPFFRDYAPTHPACAPLLPHAHTLKPSTMSSVVSPLPPKMVRVKGGRSGNTRNETSVLDQLRMCTIFFACHC